VSTCRVHDIAGELSITVGGTSKIVDRIEADGLCARRANPGDRRSSIIELTPAGERALAKAAASFEDELRRRLGSALPERAVTQLTKTITRLRTAMRPASAAHLPPAGDPHDTIPRHVHPDGSTGRRRASSDRLPAG
jgi:DNA-binding MarR family transcriptional regulator